MRGPWDVVFAIGGFSPVPGVNLRTVSELPKWRPEKTRARPALPGAATADTAFPPAAPSRSPILQIGCRPPGTAAQTAFSPIIRAGPGGSPVGGQGSLRLRLEHQPSLRAVDIGISRCPACLRLQAISANRRHTVLRTAGALFAAAVAGSPAGSRSVPEGISWRAAACPNAFRTALPGGFPAADKRGNRSASAADKRGNRGGKRRKTACAQRRWRCPAWHRN